MKQFSILDFGFSIGRSAQKKIFCFTLCAMLFALCSSADAQQSARLRRIGYLFTGFQAPKEFLDAMRGLGYIESSIERRRDRKKDFLHSPLSWRSYRLTSLWLPVALRAWQPKKRPRRSP